MILSQIFHISGRDTFPRIFLNLCPNILSAPIMSCPQKRA